MTWPNLILTFYCSWLVQIPNHRSWFATCRTETKACSIWCLEDPYRKVDTCPYSCLKDHEALRTLRIFIHSNIANCFQETKTHCVQKKTQETNYSQPALLQSKIHLPKIIQNLNLVLWVVLLPSSIYQQASYTLRIGDPEQNLQPCHKWQPN